MAITDDTAVPDYANLFRLDGRGSRVETVAGATHFLPLEKPHAVQAALRAARR
jgi:pimeloyl-ACP methyl ester carboxylesterase